MIQVACQSCERSSQAHVDVGLIYIVEGETKTAQPKWNVWIVLSCSGASVTLDPVCQVYPPRGLYLTLFVQLILEAWLVDLLYGSAL